MKLSFRQVHLDFHTSEAILNIGEKFSKKQFQDALKKGHLSSITVFSKCHHGWAYHPSKANEIHPGLDFDLLKMQIEAAHELGVKTPVYLSAGFDQKIAVKNSHWLIRDKDDKPNRNFLSAGYHLFCFNTPYLDYLAAQVEEVVANYDADAIFLDITNIMPCYCSYCRQSLKDADKDIFDDNDVMWLAERTYENYTRRMREAVDKIKPGLPLFHNGGHIRRGRRDLSAMDSHLELESLPTGGWGYDHFPLSAAYARTLGMEFLGMTGKFHKSWGEFGGYKHPNALRYETALSIANGAKCSVGDQLHPSGLMDDATYELIGAAYKEVEQKEAWCDDVTAVADIAVFSKEAADNMNSQIKLHSIKTGASDAGVVRMMLEGKYLFNVVDQFEDLNKYKLVILPDSIRINDVLKKKLDEFVKNGGKILATGESGLGMNKDEFEYDFGVECEGINPQKPDYFVPGFEMDSLKNAAFVIYGEGYKVSLNGGEELGRRENTYFNRSVEHFCSHAHTPCNGEYGGPGMAQGKDGIYIAWKVFDDYATSGALILKEMVRYAVDKLIGDSKTIKTNLPAQGVTTVMEQKMQKRYVNHILYASPVKRGLNTEVIEDIIPLYNVEVELRIPKKEITRVYLAPQMEDLDYTINGDVISYVVPKLESHQMIVLDY